MKDDKTLRNVLQEKISIIQSKLPSTAQRDIEKFMFTNFNVKADRVVDLFNRSEPIESTPYHMLYKLMTAIKEIGLKRGDFDLSDLNEETYFNAGETEDYKKPLVDKDEDFDIIIKDWHQTNVGLYSYITIHTDINEVIKWRNYNKLRFNPETQRDLVVIETNGVPVSKLDINDIAVAEMKASMLKGEYFPVPGTLNINPELYDEYPIKIKNNNLIIEKVFHIDLVEGFHNYLAYTWAKDEKTDWNYPCEFRLYLMNNEDANRYILQMDKKNHFKETQIVRMDDLNGTTYFIKTLNTTSTFHLRGTIDNNMFLYLFKLLPKMFEIDKINDAAKILRNAIPKLNDIILVTNHFETPLSKEEWFIYMYLIKETSEKDIDLGILINSLNFNSLIEEIRFKNEPSTKHYKLLNSIISGVKSNV